MKSVDPSCRGDEYRCSHCPCLSEPSRRRWGGEVANGSDVLGHIPIEIHGRNRVGARGTKRSVKYCKMYSQIHCF